jgi:hypothetical protein
MDTIMAYWQPQVEWTLHAPMMCHDMSWFVMVCQLESQHPSHAPSPDKSALEDTQKRLQCSQAFLQKHQAAATPSYQASAPTTVATTAVVPAAGDPAQVD